jgi:macrolide transport system ATP-binding/permease protein
MASATVHGCPQLLLVMITHDHAVAEHARRLIVLKDGRIVDDRPVGQPRDAEIELRVMQDGSGAGPG